MDEARILLSTYYDKMTISRFQIVKDTVGEAKMEPVIIYKDVPCALSMQTKSEPEDTEIGGETKIEYVIFAMPGISIKDKDKIVVHTGAGEVFSLRAGRSFAYPSHIEAVAYIESVA